MRLSIRSVIAGILAATPLCACTTLQAIEPVTAPPANFRSDTLTNIEFLAPVAIGWRCAERGARLMGLPAFNSGACADAAMITMIDPCLTLTAGAYARDLCAGLDAQRTRGASPATRTAKASDPIRIDFTLTGREAKQETARRDERVIAVSFLSADDLRAHCEDGPVQAGSARFSCFRTGVMFAANPCELLNQGWYERLLCHELGHINGWAANHDGGSVRPTLRLASDSPEARALMQAGGRSTGDQLSLAQNAP